MSRNPVKRVLALVMALVVVVAGIMVNPPTSEAAAKTPTSITLNATKKTLYTGGVFTLKVNSVKPGNASQDVTFKSSKSSVAAVNKNTGVVTAKKKGTATITVTSKLDSKAKAQCKVTVKQRVTGITLNKSTVSLKKGNKLTLKTTVRPTNANSKGVTWKSSKKSVASVNSKGVVTAKKAGTATITVTAKDGSGKTTQCIVGVYTKTVTSAQISKSELSLNVGKTSTLKVTVSPKGASSVYKWTSSKSGTVAVNVAGKVTAKKKGTATITGKPLDGSKSKKAVVTCKVTVLQPVTGVAINLDSQTLKVNETVQLKATVTPSNASNSAVNWISSDTSKATVSSSGLVTAKAVGTATITAAVADGSGKSASCTVKIEALKIEETVKESQKLTIIHVNDVHGYAAETETNIGYAKLAALIDQMKKEDPNTIALDAGDTFAGSPYANFDKGKSILQILNTVSFDAMVLGNHESYMGLERITEVTNSLNYKAYAGNVTATSGENLWDAYTIITLENGLKVGIVTATCGSADGLEYADPIASLQSQVDEIKAKTDVIIALTHLGVVDSSGNTSQLVAAEVNGIDVIIDGHSHTELTNGLEVNGILIAQTGEYSKNIGIMELVVTEGTVASASARLITKADMSEANEKAETLEVTKSLLEKYATYSAEVIGEAAVKLIGLKETIRRQETNLGNLYADAVRDATGAEIALCGAGIISAVDIEAGDITAGDVLSMSRVITSYAVGEMKGEDIIASLNSHVVLFPEQSGGFYQVSGIKFEIDTQGEENFVHNVYVGEFVNGTFEGEELDPNKRYKVAFAAPDKGSAEFSDIINLVENTPTSDVIIENYIKNNSPVSPEVEGRIVGNNVAADSE